MSGRCALDAGGSSRRHKDENGFLHVNASHISKEAVNPYYGREIPDWEKRGLDPDRIYYGWRSGVELAGAASTFNGLPLLRGHHVESAAAPQKEHRVGSLGTAAAFRSPYLDNSLIVTDADAIRDIENGTRMELSAAYLFEPDFTPGVFAGQPYDFVMTAIRGNHVALVPEGRAGPDVVVADAVPGVGTIGASAAGTTPPARESQSRPEGAGERHGKTADALFNSQPKRNGMTGIIETLKALVREAENLPDGTGETPAGALAPLSEPATADESTDPAARDNEPDAPEDLAARLLALVDAFDDRELADKLKTWIARLAEKDGDGGEAARDAGPGEFPGNVPGGETAASGQRDKRTESVVAGDAALAARVQRQAADDAVRRFRSMTEAARAVRPLAGELDPLAFDSAEDIYAKALELCGVRAGAYPRAAWRGMTDMLVRREAARLDGPAFAQDAASGGFDGPFAHLRNINIAR